MQFKPMKPLRFGRLQGRTSAAAGVNCELGADDPEQLPGSKPRTEGRNVCTICPGFRAALPPTQDHRARGNVSSNGSTKRGPDGDTAGDPAADPAEAVSEKALSITARLSIPLHEVEISAVRAQGPGGQNVNKTSAAIEIRFDIAASSLPQPIRARLLAQPDRRISQDGVLRIKAQEHRTQLANRRAGLARLAETIRAAATPPRPRRATAPPRASKRRRLDEKNRRGRTKGLRRPPGEDT